MGHTAILRHAVSPINAAAATGSQLHAGSSLKYTVITHPWAGDGIHLCTMNRQHDTHKTYTITNGGKIIFHSGPDMCISGLVCIREREVSAAVR